MLITSATNERIKEIKKLMKSSGKRKEKGIFLVEGIRMFREIPEKDLLTVFVAESEEAKYSAELDRVRNTEIITVKDNVFSAMSDTNTPQGILAVVKRPEFSLSDMLREENPLFLILDNLQDPGNLGTILRTSEAAGVTGILLSKESVDVYNPKVVRSTMGSIFRMPVYVSENLVEDIALLKAKGITIFGTHLDGDMFYHRDFTGGVGFLIGNEGNGLSKEVSDTADALIRIPMKGSVESLNAATSVAVVGYEVLRQRNFN